MNELFIKLFFFWGGMQLLFLVLCIAAAWGILYTWSFLWNKCWAAKNTWKVLMAAVMASLPSVWVGHAMVSSDILKNGPRVLEYRVERRLNRIVEMFCSRHATKCRSAEQFEASVIPAYAEMLLHDAAWNYLPMDTTGEFTPDDRNVRKFLIRMYAMKNSAESAFDSDGKFDMWHTVLSRYMAQQQFEQNKEKLQQDADFSPVPWFASTLLVTMIFCAYAAYRDVDTRVCYPYGG